MSKLACSRFALGLIVSALISVPALAQLPSEILNNISPEQFEQMRKLSPTEIATMRNRVADRPLSQPTNVYQVQKDKTQAERTLSQIEGRVKASGEKARLNDAREEKFIDIRKAPPKQFGYDLFEGMPTTFAPVTDIPITADYLLGPGDTILINFIGSRNESMSLVVNREGQISIPGFEPITVAGMTFEAMTNQLRQRIEQQMIGVRPAISMGPLRSIRVFILGEASQPGSYTVSALSTITNALFVSGGVKGIGSLRNIEVRRNGKTIRILDLYDLLMRGDTRGDERLQPGDVIFIPKIGPTATVIGEVLRPAIYELRGEKTAEELLNLAGGLLPTAFPQASQLERIDSLYQKTLVDANLTNGGGKLVPIQNGDTLRVYSVLDKLERVVLLSGHVVRPGGVQWRPGMRLTDMIKSQDELLPKADLDYVVIKREVPPDRRIHVVSVALRDAFANPESAANLALQARDEIIVFSTELQRDNALNEVTQQIKAQARYNEPERIVSIRGHVRFPGEYPFENQMTLKRLLEAALDVEPRADLDNAVLLRPQGPNRDLTALQVNLRNAIASGENTSNLALEPGDELVVFPLDNLNNQANDTNPRKNSTDFLAQPQGTPAARQANKGHQNNNPQQPPPANTGNALTPSGLNTRPGSTVEYLATRNDNNNLGNNTNHQASKDFPTGQAGAGFASYSSTIRQKNSEFPTGQAGASANAAQQQNQAPAKQDTKTTPPTREYQSRQELLQPILTRLRQQSRSNNPAKIIEVNGSVAEAGAYPLTQGMKISQLIALAGNYSEDAYMLEGELARYVIQEGQTRQVEHRRIDLAAIARGDTTQDIELQPYDSLVIRPIPGWTEQAVVEVFGRVRFPGKYVIKRGEKLSSLIKRTGGFLDYSAPEAAVFTREALRMKEQEAIDHLAQRLESELMATAMRGSNTQMSSLSPNAAALNAASNQNSGMLAALHQRLLNTKTVGRLAVDIPRILKDSDNGNSSSVDVTLDAGDKLFIPPPQESVTIIGEVNFPTSLRYEDSASMASYIDNAGGTTQNADEGRTYVIRANGKVETSSRYVAWMVGSNPSIKPGDTIVVPMDVKQVAPIAMWTSVSQIFSNLAVSLAALKTIGITR